MADTLDIFFRAYTVPVLSQKQYRAKRHATPPKEALIFRCATTDDEKKEILFGAYICAERDADSPSDSGDRLEGNSLDRSNQIYLPKPNGQQVEVTGGSSPGLDTGADAAALELGWAGCMKQEVGGPGVWP